MTHQCTSPQSCLFFSLKLAPNFVQYFPQCLWYFRALSSIKNRHCNRFPRPVPFPIYLPFSFHSDISQHKLIALLPYLKSFISSLSLGAKQNKAPCSVSQPRTISMIWFLRNTLTTAPCLQFIFYSRNPKLLVVSRSYFIFHALLMGPFTETHPLSTSSCHLIAFLTSF